MRALLLAVLLDLAACGALPAPQAHSSNNEFAATPENGAVETSCGAPSGSTSGNELEPVSMCGPDPKTPSERARAEVRAGAGSVEDMLALAYEAGTPAEARRWYAAAAAHGRCDAVRMLLDPTYQDGRNAAERRRWSAEDHRLGCSVERWTANADGSFVYAEPDNFLWEMWIGCVGRRIRITGPAGSTPSETPRFFFRTVRGDQPRAVTRAEAGGWSVLAFDAGPDDAVLSALLRGERIEVRVSPEFEGWAIDARGLRERLPALVRQCFGGG
jgi:hypothetical protein